MKVLLFGSDFFTKIISEIYQEAGHETRIMGRASLIQKVQAVKDVLWCDEVYLVSGRDLNSVKLLRLAMALKKRIIIHWTGTDVVHATQQYQKDHVVPNAQYPHIDLAVASHLQQELLEIGIHAAYVPIASQDLNFRVLPAPETHMVLCYLPEGRETFYGIEILKALAKKHPEVPFCILANNGGKDAQKLPNLHYMGTVGRKKMEELFGKCSVLLRYPEHDGLPVMMLEAQGFGRQVIHRYPFPYVITPEEDSIESIDAALRKVLSEPPRVNQEGADYVRREFTKERILQRYREAGVI